MYAIKNKFLLAGDKFMLQIHFTRFTYSVSGRFTKNREKVEKFKGTINSRYISQNKLDKAFFQYGMAYKVFKDFPRRTISYKVLCNKVFKIFQNLKTIYIKDA